MLNSKGLAIHLSAALLELLTGIGCLSRSGSTHYRTMPPTPNLADSPEDTTFNDSEYCQEI